MTVMDGWRVTVTRLRTVPDGTDQYGEPVPGTRQETPLPPALLAPGGTSEPVTPGAAPVLSAPTLYWAGQWPDVTAADLLRVSGTTWRVEGAPARWPMGTVVTLAAATSPSTTTGGTTWA